MPTFSIIIPVYKVEKYIKDCIESLITQTFDDFEALFVDDCGGDNSINIAEKYSKKDKRIKIFRLDKNQGVSVARNKALEHACGKYIICVDPDDWLELNALEILNEAVNKYDVDSIWFDGNKYYEETNKIDKNSVNSNRCGYLTVTPENIYKLSEYTCFKVFKTELIKKDNIKWPEGITLGEDSEFYYKYFTLHPNSYIIEDRLYNYRIRSGSIVTNYQKGIVQIEDLYNVVRNLKKFYQENNLWYEYKQAIFALLRKRITLAKLTAGNYEKSLQLSKEILDEFNFPNDFKQFNISLEPLVSIIIPIYNVENYIEQCIRSIQLQSYSNLEIICVDDKGIDNSIKIVESMSKQDERIKIIYHDCNKGIGAARNTGIRATNGDYIFFVDSDDWMEVECIETVIKKFQETKLDTVWFKSYVYWEDSRKKERFWEQYYMNYPEGYFRVDETNMFLFTQYVWNKGYRKDFILENNLFFVEGLYFEDMEYFLRLYLASPKTYMINKLLYTYRRWSNSVISCCTKEVKKAEDLYKINRMIYEYLVNNNLYEKFSKEFKRFTQSNLNMFSAFPNVYNQLSPIMEDLKKLINI